MTPVQMERRIEQNSNDIASLYELVADIRDTLTVHSARLDAIDARLDGIDGRLDGIDGRLDAISASVAAILTLLTAERA